MLPASMPYMVQNIQNRRVSTFLLFVLIGHFGSLNLEFEMRKENVSVTIMPLSLVYTEKVLNRVTFKPGGFFEPGITPAVSHIACILYNCKHTQISLPMKQCIESPCMQSTYTTIVNILFVVSQVLVTPLKTFIRPHKLNVTFLIPACSPIFFTASRLFCTTGGRVQPFISL